ncbi:MAG TPA: calcium-binding protein, partial [Allocoleopsis sp.]
INIQRGILTGGESDNKFDASAFKGEVRLFGEGGSDQIIGGAGSDLLRGGDQNDRFTGGVGDDDIRGDSGTDGLIEAGNVNFTLTNTSLKGKGTDILSGIEFAELTGGSSDNTLDTTQFDLGNVTLFGRAGNDILKTGKGNDTLRGDAGNDTMSGGAGIDTYFVDSTLDQVIEASATGGSDTVFSSASFTLGANVENLTLAGATTNTNGTGNGLDNTIAGDANSNTLKGKDGKDTITRGLGNDSLVGGNGNDTLSGNGGDDRFVFDTGAAFNNTTIGLDSIKDFINFGLEDDRIVLDKTTFTALKSVAGDGFSVGSDFTLVGSNSEAATSTALITYSKGTGTLFYNQNGAAAGFGTGGQFASLSGNPTLSAADFVIQA